MHGSQSTQSALSLLEEFLQPVRTAIQKEAEAKSNMDMVTVEEAEKAKAGETSTEQRNLGLEQTEEAEKSSNIGSVKENSEADGTSPVDAQGTIKMTSDEEVADKGNIGSIRTQSIEQKTAAFEKRLRRAENLGNAILKVAGEILTHESKISQKVGNPDVFDKLAAIADKEAQEFRLGLLEGMYKRAQDEVEVENANIDPAILQKCGGIEGLLDKVAQEDPGAILPEGAELPPELLGGAPMDELPAEESAEVPAEASAEGGEGGEVSDDDLNELAGALDEAGVSPEDLEQAFEDVQALQEAGVSPEELTQALEEINTEAGTAAEATPETAQEVEASQKQAALQKHASRERVNAIKAFLK
jgi:hypothetical protein